jgi:hypothetical protein
MLDGAVYLQLGPQGSRRRYATIKEGDHPSQTGPGMIRDMGAGSVAAGLSKF